MVVVARRLLLSIALIAGIYASRHMLLRGVGGFLVRADQPVRADIAVVLGGDGYGHRILKGAELAREGFVPLVLVSGPPGYYALHESELAIDMAVKRGYPREWFVAFPNECNSTDEEARAIVRELRRRGVRRYLLITSNYHTRRAGGVYRSAAPDLDMRVVAARDQYFDPEDWWTSRQGRKQAFFEWTKTLASWVGL